MFDVTRSVAPYIAETRIYCRIMKQPNIEVPKHRNTCLSDLTFPQGLVVRGFVVRGPLVLNRSQLISTDLKRSQPISTNIFYEQRCKSSQPGQQTVKFHKFNDSTIPRFNDSTIQL